MHPADCVRWYKCGLNPKQEDPQNLDEAIPTRMIPHGARKGRLSSVVPSAKRPVPHLVHHPRSRDMVPRNTTKRSQKPSTPKVTPTHKKHKVIVSTLVKHENKWRLGSSKFRAVLAENPWDVWMKSGDSYFCSTTAPNRKPISRTWVQPN